MIPFRVLVRMTSAIYVIGKQRDPPFSEDPVRSLPPCCYLPQAWSPPHQSLASPSCPGESCHCSTGKQEKDTLHYGNRGLLVKDCFLILRDRRTYCGHWKWWYDICSVMWRDEAAIVLTKKKIIHLMLDYQSYFRLLILF